MREFLQFIQIKRLVIYWVILFVILSGASLVLISTYIVIPHPVIFMAIQVHTPLIFLLFSWLHFRGLKENVWSARLSTSVIWIALTIIFSAVLVKPLYGLDWTFVISTYVLQGQLLNIGAILVGGFLAHKQRARLITIPASVEKKLEDRGI